MDKQLIERLARLAGVRMGSLLAEDELALSRFAALVAEQCREVIRGFEDWAPDGPAAACTVIQDMFGAPTFQEVDEAVEEFRALHKAAGEP